MQMPISVPGSDPAEAVYILFSCLFQADCLHSDSWTVIENLWKKEAASGLGKPGITNNLNHLM